jgi:hypothetical protein
MLSTVKVCLPSQGLETYSVLWPVGLANFSVK